MDIQSVHRKSNALRGTKVLIGVGVLSSIRSTSKYIVYLAIIRIIIINCGCIGITFY